MLISVHCAHISVSCTSCVIMTQIMSVEARHTAWHRGCGRGHVGMRKTATTLLFNTPTPHHVRMREALLYLQLYISCMVGSAVWIIKCLTLRAEPKGRAFIIHNTRACHATSVVSPDPDWSVLWLLMMRQECKFNSYLSMASFCEESSWLVLGPEWLKCCQKNEQVISQFHCQRRIS